MIRFFLFFAISLSSSLASAGQTIVYYTAKGLGTHSSVITGHFATHGAACSDLASKTGYTFNGTAGGTNSGDCYGKQGSINYTIGTYTRFSVFCTLGSDDSLNCNVPPPTCPEGQSWNSSLGLCVWDDPCGEFKGQSRGFKTSGNYKTDSNPFYQPVGDYWVSPEAIVSNGCGATVTAGTSCKVYGDGRYVCTGNAVYTGTTATTEEVSGAPDTADCSGADCPDVEPTPTSESSESCTPWVYGEYGLERQCTSNSAAERPGKGSCLTDGSLVCVKAHPIPESDTKTRTDDIKQNDTSDGGKKTDVTSTTTKTYCAAGACTTTNTTNRSTTITNGSGETVSHSGTCEGDDCADPKSKEEENDEPPGQSELPQVGEDDDPDYGESLSNFTGRIQNSPMISAVSSIAFPSGGGSCSMGSVSLWGGSISFNHFCTMAEPVLGGLRYLFLSIWAIAAVRLFMTA